MATAPIVTFRSDVPVEETMDFDAVYEPSLQLDRDDKARLLANAIAVWLFVDGELAGEVFGVPVGLLAESEPDVDPSDSSAVYCYSTTILPRFQGRGLGKLLVAYWNGLVRGKNFSKVVGHATSPQMVHIRAFFGARFGAVHAGWYGTKRVARYYECPL